MKSIVMMILLTLSLFSFGDVSKIINDIDQSIIETEKTTDIQINCVPESMELRDKFRKELMNLKKLDKFSKFSSKCSESISSAKKIGINSDDILNFIKKEVNTSLLQDENDNILNALSF